MQPGIIHLNLKEPDTPLSDIPDQSTFLSIDPLAEEWDELASRVGATTYVRPGWVAAWCRALGVCKVEIHSLKRDGRVEATCSIGRHDGDVIEVKNDHTCIVLLHAK